MSIAEYIIDINEIKRIPLVELVAPGNLKPVLLFIARLAPPCVAEGLMDLLTRSLMQLTGCVRSAATLMLHKAIQVLC